MLEKPTIEAKAIIDCMQQYYSLNIVQLEFLPIGADRHTAVYRAVSEQNESWFVKMRSGDFDEMTIIIPKLLNDQGIDRIIAPLATQSRALWGKSFDRALATGSCFIKRGDGLDQDGLPQPQ